jgi:hypothetical protein
VDRSIVEGSTHMASPVWGSSGTAAKILGTIGPCVTVIVASKNAVSIATTFRVFVFFILLSPFSDYI